jgi:hypothetical protein
VFSFERRNIITLLDLEYAVFYFAGVVDKGCGHRFGMAVVDVEPVLYIPQPIGL